jgi:glycosyltransferase involved in cell wall biosynthesis
MDNFKILFVVACIPYFPGGIVRVQLFFPFLEKLGIKYHWMNFNTPRVQRWLEQLDLSWFGRHTFTDLILRACIHITGFPYRWLSLWKILWLSRKYDLIFFQAVLPPTWFINLLSRLNQRIVFDFDDALYVRHEKRTRAMIRAAWKVTPGSHVLFNYALQYNPNVCLIPSGIPVRKYPLWMDYPERNPVCIGWIGGVSTLEQLQILEKPLKCLLEKGYKFDFLIAGAKNLPSSLSRIDGFHIIDIPCYTDDQIPDLVKTMDIGVMPLFNTPSEQGKCALKAIIYMASQIPVICSPVGEAKYIVQENLNGFFANSSEEWVEKLEQLLKDKALRIRLGRAGRTLIEEKYSDDFLFKIFLQEIITKALSEKS